MDSGRLRIAAAASAAFLLLAASEAADIEPRWPVGPDKAVQAADIPGSAVQALSLRPAEDGSVFLGWLGPVYSEVDVQKLKKTGARLWGAAGITVRSGRACFPAGDARIHAGGPVDLLPASDGGLTVAWTESASGSRDLRVQRLDDEGLPLYGPGGTVLFSGVPTVPARGLVDSTWVDSSMAAVLADGKDGVHAVAVSSEEPAGGLRYRHVSGKSRTGEADADLVIDGSAGEKRTPVLAALPDGGLAVLWWNDGAVRLQVLDAAVPRLAEGGVEVRAGAGTSWPALRATGTAKRPLLLLTLLLADGEARLLLLEADGSVLRDEACFPASTGLEEAPVVATVGGLVDGLPEGIDLHGILPGDPRGCVRSVRWPGGHWQGPEAVPPPLSVGAGQTGAIGGPLWAWDLGNGTDGRLVGFRETTVGKDLVPRLGPWVALCPGRDDGTRLAVGGKWLTLAWVDPVGGTLDAARAVLRKSGREIPLTPRVTTLRVLGAASPVRVEASLPGLRLPRPESAGDLRMLLGGEGGVVATLSITAATRGPRGAWIADLKDVATGATGKVSTGYYGKGIFVEADGVPLDAQDRALYLRLVDRGTAVSGALVLRSLPGGDRVFAPGEE